MPNEVMAHLKCKAAGTYVDCTLGGTGHSRRILEQLGPDGLLVGIDRDMDALTNARNVLKPFEANTRLFHNNFVNLPDILSRSGIGAVDGILLDLGLSFNQIVNSGRGFSFNADEPLDMRMDAAAKTATAEDIINDTKEESLSELFWKYGEERFSRKIARQIVHARKSKRIQSSRELAMIIQRAVPAKQSKHQKIHPATRVFMALRIAVNHELENLETFLGNVAELLKPEGRLLVISFHSLEDRVVKHRIRDLASPCTCPPQFPQCVCNRTPIVRVITRKAVMPTPDEIEQNPMARSARLRVAEKLPSTI